MHTRHELQNFISGLGNNTGKNTIQAAANYLRQSKKTSRNAQEQEFTKEQETAKLICWINEQDSWFNQHDESRFLASGAEQRVYLDQDSRFVYKLNDTIFYQFWLDYFCLPTYPLCLLLLSAELLLQRSDTNKKHIHCKNENEQTNCHSPNKALRLPIHFQRHSSLLFVKYTLLINQMSVDQGVGHLR
ncbi:MAG: hypothetical protein ACOVOY_11885 [Sediminibacterium sp.]